MGTIGHTATDDLSDAAELSALVDDMLAARAALARAQAAETRVLAAAVELVLARSERRRLRRSDESDLALREVAAELATAMRVSDRTVQRRMSGAFEITKGYALTLEAWERGRVDAAHVGAIVSAGGGLDPDARERFERLALAAAETTSAGRMQDLARAIAARIDPDGTTARIRDRQLDRGVRVYDLGEGMSRLLADLPAVLAHAIHDRLTQQARVVRDGTDDSAPPSPPTEGVESEIPGASHAAPDVTTCGGTPLLEDASHAVPDARTLDQLRADILSDLLLAGAPAAHGAGLDTVVAHIQVSVPLETLVDGGVVPPLLAGSGPVGSDLVRTLAGRMPTWDRVTVDPRSGAVLAVDAYRPSAALRRMLRARDEHCRFPGCRCSAPRCDIDHTHDAAWGGATSVENLSHLCRRHHTLKHETAWTVRQRGGGVLEWRSPTGRRYTDRPAATVRFVPDSDDPPPF
ncbi:MULTISPECIES: HNH endonuclease signature motif containing protein [unclassified Microbacterium]|uniref:HNH endonuclease signature motif containing protein n=1 Tax=unclassified Microbacterium TaxID=2609290 RepID=UPI003017E468